MRAFVTVCTYVISRIAAQFARRSNNNSVEFYLLCTVLKEGLTTEMAKIHELMLIYALNVYVYLCMLFAYTILLWAYFTKMYRRIDTKPSYLYLYKGN